MVVAGVALTACGIEPDNAPRNIPVDQRAQIEPTDVDAGESTGTSRVFMLTEGGEDGQRLLRSVLRDVQTTPTEVLQALLDGPNAKELEEGLSTQLPPEVQLISPPRNVGGTLNVDLSPEILELQSSALRYAVAQIVYTADELDGVRSVRLRVDGERQAWPAGRGELINDPLTVCDFAGFAESAQPAYPSIPSAQT
jgi:spore germination protein GerM